MHVLKVQAEGRVLAPLQELISTDRALRAKRRKASLGDLSVLAARAALLAAKLGTQMSALPPRW